MINHIRLIDLDCEAQRGLLVQLRHYAFQIRYEVNTGQSLQGKTTSLDDLYMLVPVIKALHVTHQTSEVRQPAAGGAAGAGDTRAAWELRAAARRFDAAMLNSALESIQALVLARYERWDLFGKEIAPGIWALLVTSANLTFVGVLLMQSGHFTMDFAMCTLTVLSICAILFVLSDLDQFHTGAIRIDVSAMDQVFAEDRRRRKDFGEDFSSSPVVGEAWEGVRSGGGHDRRHDSSWSNIGHRLRRQSETQWGSSQRFSEDLVKTGVHDRRRGSVLGVLGVSDAGEEQAGSQHNGTVYSITRKLSHSLHESKAYGDAAVATESAGVTISRPGVRAGNTGEEQEDGDETTVVEVVSIDECYNSNLN